MSRRKSSRFLGRGRGRRSSKIMWIAIGIFVFALFVFPYFGSNLGYLISSSLSPLKSAGTLLQTCGLVITVAGVCGIGLFLRNPLNLASLFTGGSTSRGYHFFY